MTKLPDKRQIDDYCPRAQLKNCLRTVERQGFIFRRRETDGSKTMIPVDFNDTKVKLFSKADAFIAEFAGEDLRNVVFRDVNKYLSVAIENEVRKQQRQHTKSEALALSVIDWEGFKIENGNLISLYVSQLDLYLYHRAGISVKDIKAKGFNKEKKIECIRKHLYRTMTDDSRLDDVKSQTGTKPPLTAIINKPNACKQMNSNFQVISWRGSVAVNNCQIRLLNTCSLDNFLMALHFIYSTRTQDVHNLQTPLPNLLELVNNLITDRKFADANFRWLQSLVVSPQVINSEIDIFGNEHDNVIVNFSNCLKTSFSSN